jgi:hypothetical protein
VAVDTLCRVTASVDRLLQAIQAGAADSSAPIADLLRKVIALGGQAGSTELRDWATRELRGYGPDDDLPEYRKIPAPLQADMINAAWHARGQSISTLDLPEVVRDKITNLVNLGQGIGEIEQLARSATEGHLKLQPDGAPEIVRLMNARPKWNATIQEIYWSVSPVALDGIVEQVRTTLAIMVAEISANLPEGVDTPPAEVATNAITFAVTGKRNKISFAGAQGDGFAGAQGDGAVGTPSAQPDEQWLSPWLKIAGSVLLGVVFIVGLIFTLMQVQGWHFR